MAWSLIAEVFRSGYSFGMEPQEELYWQHGQSSRKAGISHTARAVVPGRI